MMLRALAICAIMSGGPAVASDRIVYTATHGNGCADRSTAHLNRSICVGPKGYSAELLDEGNLAAIAIKPPGRVSQGAYVWRGSGRAFGDRLEWRLKDDTLQAVVLRIWRAENDAAFHELVVLKITPAGACRIASVDARRADANFRARQEAALASQRMCMESADRM